MKYYEPFGQMGTNSIEFSVFQVGITLRLLPELQPGPWQNFFAAPGCKRGDGQKRRRGEARLMAFDGPQSRQGQWLGNWFP